VECSRRSSLYSLALHWHVPADSSGSAQLRVAAGSAFLHVLVWQLPAVSFASLRQAAGKTAGALFLRRRTVHLGCCDIDMHESVRVAVHGSVLQHSHSGQPSAATWSGHAQQTIRIQTLKCLQELNSLAPAAMARQCPPVRAS